MKRLLITLLALCTWSLTGAQRQSILLNRNWSYTPGWERSLTENTTTVNLPHTWNSDALSGKPDYYRGLGGYLKAIEIPKSWQGRRLFLRFGGANSVCDLYVNGKHAGQHRGGYTAFAWEITRYVNFGSRNILWVQVNNAPDWNLLPLTGDFNIYGGLYRDVELIMTPSTHIALNEHGSSGLYVTPTRVSDEQADVNVLSCIRGGSGTLAEVSFILRDAQGNILNRQSRRVKLDNNGQSDVGATFSIEQPHLWSPESPYLYDMETRVSSSDGAR